jgi:hypothetical protein
MNVITTGSFHNHQGLVLVVIFGFARDVIVVLIFPWLFISVTLSLCLIAARLWTSKTQELQIFIG